MTRKSDFFKGQVTNQRKWIDEHGGCQAAYVERYGSADDPNHYGNGGEAIWTADMAALRDYELKASV